jgi:ADP-ribosyl-[dinitrogen reductase] hydrolase
MNISRGELEDRVVGCVLGLALGDALGAPFEGMRAKDIPHPLPPLELPWMGRVGATTDDTAMARNLVASLAERRGFDPADLLRRHLEWFRSRPPGMGALTWRVLDHVDRGWDAEEAARAIWEERGPEVSAGNGSVMYCAPMGAAYASRPQELPNLASQLSGLTHHDGRCRTGCVAVTTAAAAAIRGGDGATAVSEALEAIRDRDGGEELEFLVDSVGGSRPVDGPDRGFCLFTAAVGLQALGRGLPFEEGLLRVVAMGGDTDTNAAVAGGLLGAAQGAIALPPAWLARLEDGSLIEREAVALIALAGAL